MISKLVNAIIVSMWSGSYVAFLPRVECNLIQTKDNEANHLIIYCLNCIRQGRNATYEPGLTNFSIVFGSPHAFLSLNRRVSRGCPITGVRFELFVIGYPRDFHVNYARFKGFLHNVLRRSFQNLLKHF